MKLLAVVPALMVLVSLCGSPVPPPPGTVSGAVFFDANRNGIHDRCDSPLPNVQVVATGKNDTATAHTDGRGNYTIPDAPAGDVQVGLQANDGTLWPITTPQAVHVQSSQTVSSVAIGSASQAPYPTGISSVSGIVFDDGNGNGAIDRDECALPGSYFVVQQIKAGDQTAATDFDGTYIARNVGEVGSVAFSYHATAGIKAFDDPKAEPRFAALRPTAGEDNTAACVVTVPASARYAPNVYEANIGFTERPRGGGAISGTVFNDANGNGARDEGEPPASAVSVAISRRAGGCYSGGPSVSAVSDAGGAFSVNALPDGEYAVTVTPGIFSETEILTGFFTIDPVTVAGSRVTIDVPIGIVAGATLRIHAFDDADHDGVRGPGEAPVSAVSFCTALSGVSDQYPQCAEPDENGVATVRPLVTGDYVIAVATWVPEAISTPSYGPVPAHLQAGQTTDIDFPINVLTLDEQVIQPGAENVQPLALDVCYSDPAWVQPPFDPQKAQSVEAQYAISQDQAQAMYGHGIYQAVVEGTRPDTEVWLVTSGAPSMNPQCGLSEGQVFALVDYEATEVVTTFKSSVVQVRLARRNSGLAAIVLPVTTSGGNVSYLFVDENYQPIVRCPSYRFCEWNDGTAPAPQDGLIGAGN